MDPITGFVVIFGILFVALAAGIPVAFSMGLIGFFGYWFTQGMDVALIQLGQSAYTTVSRFTISPIPLFILMGEVLYFAGVGENLFEAFEKWFWRLPGALGMTSITACAAFAAVSGSSSATTATIGLTAIPEMEKRNYSRRLIAGTMGAGGALGILIPPSVALVVLAILTEQSAGKLLIGGFIPGLVLSALFITYIGIVAKLRPAHAPRTIEKAPPLKEKILTLRVMWPILVLFILVLGGIYIGVFTPTEAAAVGAFGSLCIALVLRKLNWHALSGALLATARISCMIVTIMFGAMVFTHLLAVLQIPQQLGSLIVGLPVNRWIILLLIQFMLVVLGCVMEGIAMQFLTIPIIFPIAVGLGFDPVWFCVLYVVNAEMGLITPPVGMNLFVLQGIAPQIRYGDIVRGMVPFVLLQATGLALMMVFPQIILFLPGKMI